MKKRKLIITYSVVIVLLFILFGIPLPYFSVFPGELIDMGEVINVESDKSHFYAVSANIYRNPYSKALGLTENQFEISLFVYIIAKISPSIDIAKIPAGYENITTAEIEEYQYSLANQSNDLAKKLALEYLDLDEDVSISFGDLAGSSGSLIAALEIIQQLGNDDLIRDRIIAGTGELQKNGSIAKIGNLKQKISTAENKKVDILILPKANQGEFESTIEFLYVENLKDAVEKLVAMAGLNTGHRNISGFSSRN